MVRVEIQLEFTAAVSRGAVCEGLIVRAKIFPTQVPTSTPSCLGPVCTRGGRGEEEARAPCARAALLVTLHLDGDLGMALAGQGLSLMESTLCGWSVPGGVATSSDNAGF